MGKTYKDQSKWERKQITHRPTNISCPQCGYNSGRAFIQCPACDFILNPIPQSDPNEDSE